MVFVHPKLRAFLAATKGQPGLGDVPPAESRAASEDRAKAKPRGPDIAYVVDMTVTGDDGHAIPVRLYRPENPVGVVVAFHGGGWTVGSINTFDDVSRHIARDSGLAVVSVDYRLAPEHPWPAAIEDAWAVTRWVAAHGQEHGLPGDRLTLLGDSAGANLAAVTALRARNAGGPLIRLQVLVYPGLDARLTSSTMDTYAEGYFLSKADVAFTFRNYGAGSVIAADDWRISPLVAPALAGVAPALLISAECDPLQGDAAAYTRALLEAGVSAVHVTYTGVTHLFFGMRDSLDAAAIAQKQAALALRDAALQ